MDSLRPNFEEVCPLVRQTFSSWNEHNAQEISSAVSVIEDLVILAPVLIFPIASMSVVFKRTR